MTRKAIGFSIAKEELGAKFFANGTRQGGILEHHGIVKNPERLRKSWEEVYNGTKSSHKIAVLEEGMKYNNSSFKSNETNLC